MSDQEEDAGALGRQRSIFSGMGRVRQINQFREKWNTSKTKMHSPGAGYGDAAAPSAWTRRGAPKKYSATLRGGDKAPVSGGSDDRPRLHRALTASDLERYRSIAQWLSGSGIDIVDASQAAATARMGGIDVFDDVLESLDALEKSVETELALISGGQSSNQSATADEVDSQGNCDLTASPPICDYVVVIGPDVGDIAAKNYWNHQEDVFEATVAFAYPPHCQFNAESIEHFCFPRGIKLEVNSEGVNLTNASAEFFVLLLSGSGAQGQCVQYAFCMKGATRVPSGFESKQFEMVPICYCIVSQMPLVAFFRDVLHRLLDNLKRDTDTAAQALKCNVVSNEHSHYVDSVFRKLRSVRVAEGSSTIVVNISPASEDPIVLQRPSVDDARGILLLQWSMPLLLRSLSIDKTLQILALLLTEMKVIVVCDQLSLLSSATLGLASMLQPLSWAGPLITILPPFLHEYMEAPVPLICGIDTLPANFECTPGTGIVHLLDHRIELHADDELNSGVLRIPGADELCRDLDFFTAQIQQPKSERIVAFGVDVVIRRLRLHVQQLLDACAELEAAADTSAKLSGTFTADELKFMRSVLQTQMYQKYRDDHPMATISSRAFNLKGELDARRDKTAVGSRAKRERVSDKTEFSAAVDVIFRIALTGVNESTDDLLGPTDTFVYDTSSRSYCQHGSASIPSDPELPAESGSTEDSNGEGQQAEEASNSQSPQPLGEMVSVSNPARPGCDELESAATTLLCGHACLEVQSPSSSSVASGRQNDLVLVDLERVASDITLEDIEAEINLYSADFDSYPLRRGDTETTMSLLGTTTFSEMVLRGAGSCSEADWFSESSDGENFHDCQDSDDSRLAEADFSVSRLGGQPGGSLTQSTVSCVKIQRTWRDWIARRRRPEQMQTEAQHGSALVYDDANAQLLHRRMEMLHELGVLTRGVAVQRVIHLQEEGSHNICTGRLRVSADILHLEWRRTSAMASDECIDTIQLELVRRISSHVSASNADGAHSTPTVGWLVTEVHYDGGMWRFRHDMLAQDFFCFLRWVIVSTLSLDGGDSSDSRTISSRSLPVSIFKDSESHADMATRGMSIESASLSSSYDQTCLDRFKTALRVGFLVEKHGRSGKPHAKMLYVDAACTQIVWKKPSASRPAEPTMPTAASASFFRKSMAVGSIKAVLGGKQTLVFNRSTARDADEKLCLSIVSATRTLDVRAYSREDYELLFCGLALLVKANATPRL